MTDIYYIGGSPCSGKSTAAEIISRKYDMYYFKVDDFLDEYAEKAAACKKPICSKLKNMTPEQIWMRDPREQNMEELQFYEEIAEFAFQNLLNISSHSSIITEGAAFIPQIMSKYNIQPNCYINITPTPEFQVSHFKEREWISYVLEGCSDKEAAFMNWMKRDILFADAVREQCKVLGYKSFLNDGTISVEDMIKMVCRHFNLEK